MPQGMSLLQSIADFVRGEKDISDLMSIHVETDYFTNDYVANDEAIPLKFQETITKLKDDEEFEDLESQR